MSQFPLRRSNGYSALPGANAPRSYGDLMGLQAQAQAQMGMADSLMNQEYIPNSGAMGAIAKILSSYAGYKLKDKANKSITEFANEQFEMEEAARQQQHQQEMAAAEDKVAREYEMTKQRRMQEAAEMGLSGQAASRYAATGKVPESTKKFQGGFFIDEATGKVQAVPEYLNAQKALRSAGRTQVNVSNSPGITAFEKALGNKDAESFSNWRQGAVDAQGTIDQLSVVEKIANAEQTGKLEEAMAVAGQYLGTDAGANYQSMQAAKNRMVLDLAQKMKGALSDSDRRMLEQSLPSYGNDPRANQVVIGLIKKGADRQIGLYNDADAYVSKNRSLAGFKPSIAPTSAAESSTGNVSSSPVQGARQAPDGHWYVQKNGQWFKVD